MENIISSKRGSTNNFFIVMIRADGKMFKIIYMALNIQYVVYASILLPIINVYSPTKGISKAILL